MAEAPFSLADRFFVRKVRFRHLWTLRVSPEIRTAFEGLLWNLERLNEQLLDPKALTEKRRLQSICCRMLGRLPKLQLVPDPEPPADDNGTLGTIGQAVQLPDIGDCRAEFKRRTGHEYPETPAQWRRLMVLADFTDKQVTAAEKGNWADYGDGSETGYPTPEQPCNMSFTERLLVKLEQQHMQQTGRKPGKRGRPRKCEERDREALRLRDEGLSIDQIRERMPGQFKSPRAASTAINRARKSSPK